MDRQNMLGVVWHLIKELYLISKSRKNIKQFVLVVQIQKQMILQRRCIREIDQTGNIKCIMIGLYPNENIQPIIVPLKTCQYDIQIVNTLANVHLTQTYINSTDKFLQLTYRFPIHYNACVYKFVASYGSTRIEGIVKQKEEAKRQYTQAIKQGKQAAYGEITSESKDIMNLRVGSIAPKEQIKIEIQYLQQLTLGCNMFYQFHLMGNISPRYMSEFPPEYFQHHFRNQEKKTKGQFYWNFTIKLITTHKINFFSSKTHQLQVLSCNDQQTQYSFSLSKQCIPNKDFSFSYSTQDYHLPSYVFGRTDHSSTAVLSFVPKFCDLTVQDAYKAFLQTNTVEPDMDNAKGEYIFLIDRSGSMAGSRIQKAKQALILFLQSLPEDSFFNVYSFGDINRKLFVNSVRYTSKQIEKARMQINKFKADMGGTKIYALLEQILKGKTIADYPKQIYLLTDGQVSNTEQVIRLIGANNKYSRVHTIGIGNGTSQALIVGCATKGKGYHTFISNEQDPSQKIIQLLTNSLSPVISKMKLSYDKTLIESIIPNPESMPYILKDEIVKFYITFKGQISNMAQFQFTYQDSKDKQKYKSNIIIDPQAPNYSYVDRLAHFKKIKLLEESHSNNANLEDLIYCVKIVDKKAEIIKESIRHQILSQFTAFLCVEKQLKDGKYHEIQAKGKVFITINQPAPVQKQGGMLKQRRIAGLRASPVLYKKMPTITSNAIQYSGQLKLSTKSIKSSSKMQVLPGSKAQNQMKKPSYSISTSKTQADLQSQLPYEYQKKMKEQHDYRDLLSNEEQERYKKKKKCVAKKIETIPTKYKQKQSQNIKDKADKKQKKEQLIKVEQTKDITSIISQQQTQGSWNNLSLITLLFDEKLKIEIESKPNVTLIITFLIIKWIQKHFPQPQYTLVIKKGHNYIKKNAKVGQKQDLDNIYGKLIL